MNNTTTPVFEFKELEKFVMFTDAPGAPGKRSRLVWSSFKGNPRITVFTGVPNDSGKGVINAPMNPETFLILMDLLKDLCQGTGEVKNKIACYTLMKGEAGAPRSQEQTLLSDIYIGRDTEGIIWISVVVVNRPKIKFEFRISDFHKLYKGDGTQFTAAEASALQTRAYVNGVTGSLMSHMADLRPPYNGGIKNVVNKTNESTIKDADFEDLTF
jgi:hypothetical protein